MNVKDLSFSQLVNLAVNVGQFPRYIYKYRAINENTENIFTQRTLWFSNPDSFNDPFDCQIIVEANNSVDEIALFLRQNAPEMPTKDVKEYSKYWAKNMHEWRKMINQIVRQKINESGICCFAGSDDNILMWSHYGDSHKGICIKFDLLADPDFFAVPLKVKYDMNYPRYNHLNNSAKLVEHLIMTKANCWEYEQELRVLKQKFGLVSFKKEAIVEVTFGCNSSDKDIKRIKDLILKSDFANIKLSKATKSKSSFRLDIKDIK